VRRVRRETYITASLASSFVLDRIMRLHGTQIAIKEEAHQEALGKVIHVLCECHDIVALTPGIHTQRARERERERERERALVSDPMKCPRASTATGWISSTCNKCRSYHASFGCTSCKSSSAGVASLVRSGHRPSKSMVRRVASCTVSRERDRSLYPCTCTTCESPSNAA